MPEIQALKENLTGQLTLYRELTELGEVKKEALVKNNILEIQAITSREEALVLEGTRLEKERLMYLKEIAKPLGVLPEALTISELVKHFPELNGIRNELDDVLSKLQRIHQLNTELLKQAVSLVNVTLNMLTSPQTKNLYNRPGGKEVQPQQKISFLDKSI